MGTFLQDLRYAFRGLGRAKGFTAVAILCLGFGIGANSTIFSVADGVLLNPYPYPEPDRLLAIGEHNLKTGDQSNLSYLDLRDLRESKAGFSTIAGASGRAVTLADGSGEPTRYAAAAVSWELFPLLGATPILGQPFAEHHDQPGGGGVVILSHDLWTRRYQADPMVLGRAISIDGKPRQVIGVMGPGFAFPNQQRLWIPLAPEVSSSHRASRVIFTLGRLKPGFTIERARDEADAVFARIARESPASHEGWTSRLQTLRDAFLPDDVPLVIGIMMGSATLVLFVACSNVANLLVARASARRREISVRAALGAGRGRIVRQLLTESIALGLVSLPLGIALAEVGTRLFAGAIPPDRVPYYIRWQIDWRSLLYTVAVALSTAVVFGLFPAFQASRGNLHDSLKEGTRGNSVRRSLLRSSLVVVQVSLTLVSLVIAFLFLRTFGNINGASVGFDPTRMMTMRVFMGGEPYATAEARARRIEDIVRRVEALPSVESAFMSTLVPLDGGGGGGPVVIDGQAELPGDQPGIAFIGVTPHFIRTVGMTIQRGRDFTDAEAWPPTPVAVINEAMAQRYWTGREPIGARFRMKSQSQPLLWFTVVGVIGNAQLYGVDPEDSSPPVAAFVPYAYQGGQNVGLTIRVAGDPAAITAAARAEIRASDAHLPISEVQTMEAIRRLGFWPFAIYSWVFGTIGVTGLLLAAVGVYGVLSYGVSQRTKEIGVRIALGATRRTILSLVVGQGLVLCGIGVVIGLLLAPGATWVMRVFLYKVSPFDPWSFGAVAVLLLMVAIAASYLPARRAMRIDPVDALRGE